MRGLISYILFLFCACSSPEEQVKLLEATYLIDEHHIVEETINSKDIYADVKYIPLETSGDILIGRTVEQFEVHDFGVLILSDNKIFSFTEEGGSNFVIDKNGRGPDEYLTIYNFSVSSDTLYVYDHSQYKMLCFNAKTGVYFEHLTVPYSVKKMYFRDGLFYADRSVIPNEYVSNDERILVGHVGKMTAPRGLFSLAKGQELLHSSMYSDPDRICYVNKLSNTVYDVLPESVNARIIYDFGDRNVSLPLAQDASLTNLSKAGKVFNISNTHETTNHIVSGVMYGDKYAWMKYNKTNGTNTVYLSIEDAPYYTNPVAHAVHNDTIYKIIPAWEVMFLQSHAKELSGEKNGKLGDVINSRQESDNPILMAYTLRD